VRLRKNLLAIALSSICASTAVAQADTATAEVSGTVYDSVARAPVARAIIQLVSEADIAGGIFAATSDGRGRYSIGGVPPGRYIIGFQHVALDSLALETPLRLIVLSAGERVRVDLAVPSPARIVAAVCGQRGIADSTGLLVGVFWDARTRTVVDSGRVEARWQEISLDSSGFRTVERRSTGVVGDEGWFAVCGMPANAEVAVIGVRHADSTGIVGVTAPLDAIIRRDLFIGGTAVVHGTVLTERNRPLANARVGIIGQERTAITDSAGVFRLGDVAAGSQTLETRALGYAMDQRAVVLTADSDTSLTITLTSVRRVLDTIQVVSQRVYNRDSNGFERRRRTGFGYFFDAQTVRRRKPIDLFQLLYDVPSIRVQRVGFDRSVLMRGSMGMCVPDLFINGMRMPEELVGDLDLLARPEELEGMEVYRSSQAPGQFTNFRGCGSIVLWTRPPASPPRDK
jgi:hypothetical protein